MTRRRMLRATALLLACYMLAVLGFVGAVLLSLPGCAGAQRPPQRVPREAEIIAVARQAWLDLRLPYPADPCEGDLLAVSIDGDLSDCPEAYACAVLQPKGALIHVPSGVDPAWRERLVIHEMGHVLARCSGLSRGGDPAHQLPGIWETAGAAGFVRLAQQRAREAMR